MAFNWNQFAYTNFHELNLDWFNEHFKKIFDEWDSLYSSMLAWKETTDEEIQTLLDRSEQLIDVYEEWVQTTQTNSSDIEHLKLAVIQISASVNELRSNKLNKPTNTGSAGQVPVLQEDNTTKWANITTDPDLIRESVDDWMDDHSGSYIIPDGNVTTEKIHDNAVTLEKLSEDVVASINNINMDKFRSMTLRAIASYLAHEVGSTCVVGTPVTSSAKFVANYSATKSVEWAMTKNSAYSFDYNDTYNIGGIDFPVFYTECNTLLNLITRGVDYENSPYLYAFNNVSDADSKHIQYLFMENGGIDNENPTIDFLNVLTTYRNAKILENAGAVLLKAAVKIDNVVSYNEDIFSALETGDIVFIADNNNANYKGIHHCAYYIKNISDLNPYGSEYAITFKSATELISGTGEHGFLFEAGGSLNINNNYTDIIRIRDLELSMENTSGNDILYIAKPISNPLTSNKKLREATGLYAWKDYVSRYNRFPASENEAIPEHGLVFTGIYNKSYTLNGNSTLWITREDFNYSPIPGYHSAGVVGFNSGDSDVLCMVVRNPDTNDSFVRLKNLSSSSKSYTCTVTVLFVKDDLYY